MRGLFDSGNLAHDVILAVLALIGVVVTAWASIRVAKIAKGTNQKAEQNSSALTWAAQMSARLTDVERKVTELEGKLTIADRVISALSGYVDALLWWIKTGQAGPMPRPPVIVHDHLDPNLLDIDPPVAHDAPPQR